MLSTDMFIVTPFYREQIILTGVITEQPDIPFSAYSVFVLRTRLESFLRKYFSTKKYNYNTFTFRDIPHQGKMITTLEMLDVQENKIKLTTQEIREINQEIGQITTLHPSYCLFFEYSEDFPQAWLRTLLPSFKFERTEYYPDDSSKTFLIPSIYSNGKIYLDLSSDLSYSSTIKNLYSDFMEQLERYFYTGTIPDLVEVGPNRTERVPGKFVQFPDKTGEQVLDDIAELIPVHIPVSDYEFIAESKSKNINTKQTTVFVLNFTKTNPDINIFIDPIGVEFLTSIKNFLKADEVLIQEAAPAYYEIELKRDGNFIQSNINIKEMFGYFYLTDHPIGLLVADDMDMLDDCKIIYDSVSGKGGLFVPMVHLDEPVKKDLLKMQLENRMKTMNVYTKTPEIEMMLQKLGLVVKASIDNYFYINKNEYITKRVVYRGLKYYPPQMLLAGNWDFDTIPSKVVLDYAKELLKTEDIEEGPFSTIKVPVKNLNSISKLKSELEEKVDLKFHPDRKF